MKRSKAKDPTVASAFPHPVFPMIDNLIDVLPKIEKQQKAIIAYQRTCAKASAKLIEDLDKIQNEPEKDYKPLGEAQLPPPVIPLLNRVIKFLPKFEKQQKVIITYQKSVAKAALKLIEDLDKINSGGNKP